MNRDENPNQDTAQAELGGQVYNARVEQARDSAFVEVWGDHGYDVDARVPTTDARLEMTRALEGTSTLPENVAGVLRQAGLIFQRHDAGATTAPTGE